MSKPEVKIIGIAEIRENPVALRAVNLEGEQFLGLRDSIAKVGVMNAISVRLKKENVDGKEITYYELLDGLHRYSAAKSCGIKDIAVVVKSMDDATALEAQAMANLHVVRTKPVEFTRQLQRIFASNPTLTLAEMATKVCKSITWVSQRLDLLKLEGSIQKQVDAGNIKVSNAVALAKLPPAEQINYVEQAASMPSEEFVPLVQSRAKEIKDANRKGRSTEPAVFVPIPRVQKMAALKDEFNKATIGPVLVKQNRVKSAVDGFALGVAWTLSMDPTSVDVRTAADTDKKAKLLEAKKKRTAERTKEKAEAAQKAAVEAAEAVST